MALSKHKVLAAAGTIVSPGTTLAQLQDAGSVQVLVTTDQNVRFTVDGLTDPVITGGAEVGILLTSSDSVLLTAEEFVNSKWLDVSTDARIQFAFLSAVRERS